MFIIAKVNASNYKDKNKTISGTLEPLQFDFATPEPIFPLKLTSLNKGKSKILIYAITKSRVDAKGFKTLYAADCFTGRERYYSATKSLSLVTEGFQFGNNKYSDGSIPEVAWITKLTADLISKDMSNDLIISKAKTNEILFPKDKYVPLTENLGAILWVIISLGLISFAVHPFLGLIYLITMVSIVSIFVARSKRKFRTLILALLASYFTPLILIIVGSYLVNWLSQPFNFFIFLCLCFAGLVISYFRRKTGYKLFLIIAFIILFLLAGIYKFINS